MSSKVISALNNSNSVKIYWIFLYSYSSDVSKTLPSDKILLFPLSIYTCKNGAIPTLVSERTLDLDSDEDLDYIINQLKLNYVRSVSEMVVSKNTNLVAIQIDSCKRLKGYKKENQIYFYTLENSPLECIHEGQLKNKHLLRKMRVSIGNRNIINTNVTYEKIFTFLFKEHFDTVYNFNNTQTEYSVIKRVIKDKEELVEDGYDSDSTTDSQLSFYSYNKKYNIKEI